MPAAVPGEPRRVRRFAALVTAIAASALGLFAVWLVLARGDYDGGVAAVTSTRRAATSDRVVGTDATAPTTTPEPTAPISAPVTVATTSNTVPATPAAVPEPAVDHGTLAPAGDTTGTVAATTAASEAPAPSTAPDETGVAAAAPSYSGSGDSVIDILGLDPGLRVIDVVHSGPGPIEVATLDEDSNQLTLLESTVGAVEGTYPLAFRGDPVPAFLRVDADGPWQLVVKSVEDVRVWQADFVAGSGAEVMRFEGGASALDYSTTGTSNFIVRYERESTFYLLVNDVGPVSGSTTMEAGPGVVFVDAEGDWILNAKPL